MWDIRVLSSFTTFRVLQYQLWPKFVTFLCHCDIHFVVKKEGKRGTNIAVMCVLQYVNMRELFALYLAVDSRQWANSKERESCWLQQSCLFTNHYLCRSCEINLFTIWPKEKPRNLGLVKTIALQGNRATFHLEEKAVLSILWAFVWGQQGYLKGFKKAPDTGDKACL